jgi:hypothetical protein
MSRTITLDGKRSVIVLEVDDDAAALAMAEKLAALLGCAVTIRDAELIEIETIPAPVKH